MPFKYLGIATIKDRIIQCLIKYILEPVYEAYASKGSWAFRPGRSIWEVIMNIFFNLRQPSTNYKKRILELDIEKCFDKMNHVVLMNEIHLPINMQRIIRSALKAGVLHETIYNSKSNPLMVELYPLYYVILHYMVLRTYGINQLNTSANLGSYSNQKIRYSATRN